MQEIECETAKFDHLEALEIHVSYTIQQAL